jgi:hypothetical protein
MCPLFTGNTGHCLDAELIVQVQAPSQPGQTSVSDGEGSSQSTIHRLEATIKRLKASTDAAVRCSFLL